MSMICKHHNLTTEHVTKLTEFTDSAIDAARKDTKATTADLAALFDLRKVVSSIGGGVEAAPQEVAVKRTRNKKPPADPPAAAEPPIE